MRDPARRAGRLPWRLARRLLGRNELRRPADRIETVVIFSLAAAFLTAAVAAGCFARHLYQSQHATAAGLRPAVAVLSQPGSGITAPAAAVGARWRLPSGTERSGTLTTMTAPAIYYAPAGTSIQIWLDRSGEPEAPPSSSDDMIFLALIVGFTITAGATVVLVLCYSFCRMVLDRHRLAAWESAWAAVGPRWTSHR